MNWFQWTFMWVGILQTGVLTAAALGVAIIALKPEAADATTA